MAGMNFRVLVIWGVAVGLLAGCEPGSNPLAPAPGDGSPSLADTATDAPVAEATSVKLVDQDVEAPEVFQVTDEALWDGRPSLGGVWVASPDAKDPERVILRNQANGRFVIGALFRRERDNPGPPLQISSDAAAALGMLAGEPATINVTALRREEVQAAAPDATKPILDTAETVETTAIDPLAAVAGAAIDEAEGKAPAAPEAPAVKPVETTEATAAPQATGGATIQIGIFSVEANATRAVETLAKAGVTASVKKEESQGKAFWSVTARGDADTLATIKAAGFADAYVLQH